MRSVARYINMCNLLRLSYRHRKSYGMKIWARRTLKLSLRKTSKTDNNTAQIRQSQHVNVECKIESKQRTERAAFNSSIFILSHTPDRWVIGSNSHCVLRTFSEFQIFLYKSVVRGTTCGCVCSKTIPFFKYFRVGGTRILNIPPTAPSAFPLRSIHSTCTSLHRQ